MEVSKQFYLGYVNSMETDWKLLRNPNLELLKCKHMRTEVK